MSTAATANPAPELHPSLDWLNAEPQTLAANHGRVRLVFFWNAASVYCATLAETVNRLQARHPRGLSVFAVHLPKFDAELDRALVLKAAHRLGLTCPVANDRGWVTWQHFNLTAWPCIVLIDAEGQIRHAIVGDQPGMALDNAVLELLAEPAVQSLPQTFTRRGDEPRSHLSFPCGIAVSDGHLYVADTRHHRILECTHDGRVLRQFGSGQAELVDGAAEEAGFRSPRGLCLMRNALYVADAGNHALRRITLLTGAVETLLGDGKPGLPSEGTPESPAAIRLNQPWNVVGGEDRLFIAMAGSNQIWEYDLRKAHVKCLAGSGELGIADGPGRTALFAQPAGLALVQQNLYVAGAGGSAIRCVQTTTGAVQTLVGQGMYEFGDQDGQRREARMQFPLALALDPNSPVLWVADAYNRRLRRLRLGGGDMLTHELSEPLQLPSALAVGAGALWIADCDAHAILRLDQATGELTRLPIGE